LTEPESFIETFGTIRTQKQGVVPFLLWPWQREWLRQSTDSDIINKSRDIGSSAIVICRDVIRSLWAGGDILIAADKEDNAINLLSIARIFLLGLDLGVRMETDNKTELVMGPPYDFCINALSRPVSAQKSSAGRSERCLRLICTEMEFWPSEDDYLASVTGAQVAGATTVIESTPGVEGSLFDRIRREAKRGENGFRYFEHDWRANPTHDEVWEKDKRDKLRDRFAVEHECQCKQGGETAIFRYIDKRSLLTPEAPQKGRDYIIGLDLARIQDYTTAAVFERMPKGLKQVRLDRYRRVDWNIQEMRIAELAKFYNNAAIWMDATGLGDPEEERLRRAGLNVEGVKFSEGIIKSNMVNNLARMLEDGTIDLLNDETQKDELRIYKYTIMPSKHVKYGAPGAMHDDIVTALMLAAWGAITSVPVRAERFSPISRF
jgi:phage FluMu gp28-like protein